MAGMKNGNTGTKHKRNFLKIFLYILVVLLLLASAVVLVVKTFEKEIKLKVINQVSTYFITGVDAKDISLSPFRRFPRITIVVKGFEAGELPASSSQKVVSASRIYLTMNIINFIRKNYVIESIDISGLQLNLKFYSNGRNNYEIWKAPDQKPGEKEQPFRFDLDKIRITSGSFIFEDFKSKTRLESDLKRIDFRGKFSDKKSLISASLKSNIIKLNCGDSLIFMDFNFNVRSDININNSNGEIRFANSNLELDDASFDFSGVIRQEQKSKHTWVDMKISGKEFELSDMQKMIPEKFKEQYKDYKCSGLIELSVILKGYFSENSFPAVNIGFNINGGKLAHQGNSIELKNIFLNGNFTNGAEHNSVSTKLEIKEITASIFDKKVSGYFRIENFNDPLVDFKTSADIDLNKFMKFVKIPGFSEASGTAIFHASVKGRYNDLKIGKTENSLIEGKLFLHDVSIKHDSAGLPYENLNGSLNLEGNEMTINELSGKIGATDFNLKGKAVNFISWLLAENQKLTINAKLKSEYIDMNQLVPEDDNNKNSHKTSSQSAENKNILLPSNTDVYFNVDCDALVYRKFIGRNIRGKFKLVDGKAYADSLFFNSAGGSMVMTGKMEHKNNLYFVSGFAVANDIDITNLFYIFNNFDQDFITDKHLKGKVSGDIKINISFDNDFVVNEDKVYVIADLEILKAELNNFEPLIDLMGFIRMKKMKNVVFDRLENILIIKDRKVIIPTMIMNSNAFSIAVSGEHTFDNNLNYNLKINLTKFFFSKNNLIQSEFTDGEEDQKGGLNLYVVMYGSGDDIKYKFDRKAIRSKFKNDYIEQKKELKELLRKQKKTGEEEYEFEWEEN